MARLTDQVAIVTGGGRGIGMAIAHALAREGATVVLAGRTESALHRVAEELKQYGASALAVPTDVTRDDQIQSLVLTTVHKFGRLDILVNNAGVGYLKRLTELSVEEFDTMWRVNMRGAFVMTKAVIPYMVEAKSGAIVNIASLAGKNSFIGGTGYAATKWGLRGFAGSLMLEVRESNIRVITIFPGSVDTHFSSSNLRGNKITQAEDVAEAVVFGITAPARTMISEMDIRPTNPK
ncbi:MAG: SDR family NAD(P)-dependent oxidoreductase [Ignavibacteriae bacterium]|nr:SDR family NAD(P)-dependent oxidoreductase [Ignavibacteriota bacterium]